MLVAYGPLSLINHPGHRSVRHPHATGRPTYRKNWRVRLLYGAYSPWELFWIDSNGRNGN